MAKMVNEWSRHRMSCRERISLVLRIADRMIDLTVQAPLQVMLGNVSCLTIKMILDV